MLNFNELPIDLKTTVSRRFNIHGLDPEPAYDRLVPQEIKVQGQEAIEAFFKNKDISHIYPTSRYPELAGEIDNVFMEDYSINRARGANIVSSHEIYEAGQDSVRDAYHGDINGDGILDFEPQYDQLNFLATEPQVFDVALASENLALEGAAEITMAEMAATEGLVESEAIFGDIAENSLTGAVAGSAFTVAFYVALKTILSLEGARRRGEVTWVDVAEKTFAEVSRVLPMAVGVSLVIGIIGAIFGSWILIPLMPVAAYYGVKAPIKLFTTYWEGLDTSQKAEIKQLAMDLGGKVEKWVRDLDSGVKKGGYA
jgi:hypothetical protein